MFDERLTQHLVPERGTEGKQAVVIVGVWPRGTEDDNRIMAMSFRKLLAVKLGWMKIRATVYSCDGIGSLLLLASHSPNRIRSGLPFVLYCNEIYFNEDSVLKFKILQVVVHSMSCCYNMKIIYQSSASNVNVISQNYCLPRICSESCLSSSRWPSSWNRRVPNSTWIAWSGTAAVQAKLAHWWRYYLWSQATLYWRRSTNSGGYCRWRNSRLKLHLTNNVGFIVFLPKRSFKKFLNSGFIKDPLAI